jgi:hypothetical protein
MDWESLRPIRFSISRQIFDPFKDSKDVWIASKIIFSRSNTEKMTALLVPHGALDALCKKRKLILRRLWARHPVLTGSPENLRSSLTNRLLFCFRPRVRTRPSIPSNAPVSFQPRGLLGRNVTLGAPTFWALKNIVDEARALDFLAGKSHLGIAFNAEGIGLYNWLDHAVIQSFIKKESRMPATRSKKPSSQAASAYVQIPYVNLISRLSTSAIERYRAIEQPESVL